MSKIVLQGQSFLDKVIENTGSIENAFEMALLNGLSLTDDVSIGKTLAISTISNNVVAATYNEFNRPATGLTQTQSIEMQSLGIGFMGIGTNFIVE